MRLIKIIGLILVLTATLLPRSWEEIKSSGKLIIASREKDGVYEKNGDNKSGFHYDLIKTFADENNLSLHIMTATKIATYFTEKDGKIAVLEKIDIMVDNITIMPEREQWYDFISIFPIKEILVTKKGNPIAHGGQLKGKTVIVAKKSSYEQSLKDLEKQRKLDFKWIYTEKTDEQLPKLLSGEGDITVLDSNFAAMKLFDVDLILNASVGSTKYIGWGVAKGNTELKEALEKYVTGIKDSGALAKTWDKNIDTLTYEEYLAIAQE